MQAREIERTGIATLKVGFNRVFGFYIEITNANSQRVPTDYIRKQTLKNAERFVTPELKEYEAKVLTAEERSKALEFELFQELRGAVAHETERIKATADAIGTLDVLLALAQVAALHGYVRPEVDDGDALVIEDGRHPVLLNTRGAARFVPNGCTLIGATRRLGIVTGPNMAGKSTYIRQVALLQILAQIGSFVPAKAMRCGVVDRVFARVGASDDLARGNSTFMVEMAETANILNNATARSLIILDEVGRGTSTFDGLAIAWAISEHLLNTVKARALFATHYHQLIALAETYPAVVNLNVAVREWGDEIVFLHQIVEGGSDRSYGIHVARLAGVPKPVLLRANEILRQLEASSPDLRKTEIAKGSTDGAARAPTNAPASARKAQPSLFDPPSPEKELAKQLKALDLDRMTPIDALMALKALRDQLGR
jgi:DNA mismatch repair protein MutS